MSSSTGDVRDEVVAWLDEHWDLDRTVGEWWQLPERDLPFRELKVGTQRSEAR